MKNIKRKSLVAVLIPANNEEHVIAKTLKAILKIVPSKDIYVVDDGSLDKTSKIARRYTKKILMTKQNRGKANALNSGIKFFKLSDRYEYIFFIDADSKPKRDFIIKTFKHLRKDKYKEISCVIGRIKASGNNWISKYRQWEYQISYLIHKKAQEHMGSILVTPGCATIYRSSVFKKLKFPKGTLTEDMDLTFLMHRSGLNKMVFENKAIVYTWDPQNVKEFMMQINRWYTGFWQVVRKHNIPWQGQILDLEVTILALEGLYNGFLVIFFAISFISLSMNGKISIVVFPLLFDFFFFFLPSLIWSIYYDKNYSRILYIPHFYFLRFLSSAIFLKSFFNSFLKREEKEYVWNSKRYVERGMS
ncbi:MAG: glycosyltransferase family 2 protein [Patescibacteria group bacterium]|nr:glycosyltransferase family 2 protein [Patescibacteria group bacterium]